MASTDSTFLSDDAATRAFGAGLASKLRAGDLVLLEGELGAGKTTLVRGLLEGLGWTEPVRSPTFNIIQVFPTSPPVMHADLYRLKSSSGLGLEDYLDTHLCLVEWPDRAPELQDVATWLVHLDPSGDGRMVTVLRQASTSP